MRIEFVVHGHPVAKGRPKFYRKGKFVGTYTPKKTEQAEYDFKVQALPHRPEQPIEGKSITMAIKVFKAIPKSFSKKKNELIQCGTLRPITRPDADNFLKLVLDSMNGIFWKDDSQIVDVRIEKFYSVRPRVHVEMSW